MTPPLLQARAITVTYPGVRALDAVDLDVNPGEIHALMGENGAGKSTLVNILTGLRRPDSGTLSLRAHPFHPASVHDAERAGISAVRQEIDLIPTMSIEDNLLLARHPTRLGIFRGTESHRRATAALARLGLSLNLSRPLSDLPVGLQQMVAIARALDIDAKVLVLDEPTSSLDAAETRELFRVIRTLRDRGLAIIFISHFLDQVYEISDRITVLRNGAKVGSWPTRDLPRPALIEAMTGRAFATLAPPAQREGGRGGGFGAHNQVSEFTPASAARDPRVHPIAPTPALEFRSLSRRPALTPVSGHVLPGESVGLAGLLGSGRTELARLLFGADTPDSGEIRANGTDLRTGSIRDSIAHHIAFIPEDRKTQGLILDLSVRENIILALQARKGSLKPIPRPEQLRLANHYITALNIRTPSPETPVGSLSGGNQQKVLLARWLAIQPKILILDEPTRGVDVGARAEIESLITDLRAKGMAIILISAELDEITRTCNRVMVMRDRACVGELSGASVDERSILLLIAGDTSLRAEPQP